MKVALVVAANKFTGAAAVAEHHCRALRSAGVEARLIFRGGRNLERRLAEAGWADPALIKESLPGQLWSNLKRLKEAAEWADVVICHLPHDHFLCWLAGVEKKAILVRSVRNLGHARSLSLRFLAGRGIRGLMFAHQEMVKFEHLPAMVAPVPVEDRFFEKVDSSLWRRRLEIPEGAEVIGAVGKLAHGRGFELFIKCLAQLPSYVYGVIAGIGELRPSLEALAEEVGVGTRLRWAGYQEEELPALFGTFDIVLVTSMGSDHGHRVISEAQAASKAVVSANFAGASDLIVQGRSGVLCQAERDDMAGVIQSLFEDRERLLHIGRDGKNAASQRRFEKVGGSLHNFLNSL